MSPRQLLSLVAIALAGCFGAAPPTTSNPQQAVGSCPPSPAGNVFQNALCLCGDFAEVGASVATHAASGGAASVGVNGHTQVVGLDAVEGSWVAYQGMDGTGRAKVRDDLSTTGNLAGVGSLDVGHDLSVGGNLLGVGLVQVGGTLRVAGQNATIGLDQVGAVGAYSPPAGPPCACNGASFFDVAGAVAAAKSKNDNAAHGLPTSMATIGLDRVTLKTGSYYFNHVETIGATHFVVDGVVALYLDGSIDTVGAEWIEVKPGATLDLYVSGQVRTVGTFGLGSDPSAVRLYIGGDDGAILSVGLQELSAMIYAPTARIAFVGGTAIHGALFGRDLDGVGLLTIDYSAPQAPNPNQCPPSGTGGNGSGTSGSGGGSSGGGSGSGGGGGSPTPTPPNQSGPPIG